MPSKKRKLSKITFDFKGAHLAYTDASQGGAASGYNEAILLKSNLTKEQLALLQDIDEGFTPLDKNTGVSVSSDVELENKQLEDSSKDVSKNNEEGKTKTMSEQDELIKTLQEKIAKMEAQATLEKTKGVLAKYSFSEDLLKSVAAVLSSLQEDAVDSLLKAFDAITDKSQEEVATLTKSLEDIKSKEADVIKSLQEDLTKEVGHSAEVEAPIEKSEAELRAEKVAQFYSAQLEQIQKGNR